MMMMRTGFHSGAENLEFIVGATVTFAFLSLAGNVKGSNPDEILFFVILRMKGFH